MRITLAAVLAATLTTFSAHGQVLVTGITASFPDPNGKVPTFNGVPGAGIANWDNSLAQGVLVQGDYYNFCVSLAAATASGTASVSYAVTRGKTKILSATIVKSLTVGTDGVWYECSGYTKLPSSPGKATLAAIAEYTATGSTKPVKSKLNVPVILQ